MGQKVHPIGFRLGIIKTWNSRWYADKNYDVLLHEDMKIKRFVKKQLNQAGISSVEIERAANKLRINIAAARPGIIIGKKGSEIEKLKAEIQKLTDREVFVNIIEVQRPEVDAQLVAENVCQQLMKTGCLSQGHEARRRFSDEVWCKGCKNCLFRPSGWS